MKNIKKLLLINIFFVLIILRPSSCSLIKLLKAGELNKYLGFNKNLVTCSNILRYKLFINPNWIQDNLYKLAHDVEEQNFIVEFLRQCSNYVSHPEFLFTKEFSIGGSKIKFNEEMYYLDMVDYAFHI